MIRTLVLWAALAGIPAFAVAADTDAATDSAKAVNAVCPITRKPVQEGFTDVYKGQVIGFCCNACRETWLVLNGEDKDRLLAKIGLK